MVNVKEHITGNQKVRFEFCRDAILFYRTEKGLLFEVPITDTRKGCFTAEDRAMLYMKWIRKQLEENEKGRKKCQPGQ